MVDVLVDAFSSFYYLYSTLSVGDRRGNWPIKPVSAKVLYENRWRKTVKVTTS